MVGNRHYSTGTIEGSPLYYVFALFRFVSCTVMDFFVTRQEKSMLASIFFLLRRRATRVVGKTWVPGIRQSS